MTFTFKLSRRLALIFAAIAGGSIVGCSIDEPSGTVPFVPAFPFAVGDTLFSDGFESGVLSWDDNYSASSKQIVTAAARTGTRGLRVTFSPTTDAGTLSKFVTRGDRVYVRAAVRFPSAWTGATGLLSLRAAPATNQWASFGVAGLCPTGSTWAVTGMTTTTPNLDLRFNTSYVGMPTVSTGRCQASPGLSGPSTATYTPPLAMSKGAWHTVEIEAQLNTVGSADGWQRVWLDGVLTGEWNGLTFRTSSTVQWNAVSLEMPSSGVTQTQSLDVDDIFVGRQRPAGESTPTPTPPPPPAPEALFTESFENTSFASRGWYDFASTPVVTTAERHSGTGSLLIQLAAGAQTPPMRVMRKLFTPTDRLYVSYWVKYSTNYVGSGKSYHPHEFNILSNQDQDWDALTFNYLNAYIEQSYQNGGIPRVSIQDSRMIDVGRIGQNLTTVTEQRSVGGCNGSDGTGVTDCYQAGSQWYNIKTWDAAAVAFMPSPGANYKSNWNQVEVEFQLNSIVGGIGQKDGVVRYWLNGSLKLERTNVVFRTGANPTLKFRQFIVSPYIGDGSPVAQSVWIDDLTVATARSGSTTPPPPQPVPVASVTVSPASASVQVGGTTALNAVVRDAAGVILGGRLVSWTTSNATVATVVNGIVTGISTGQATITATSEGRSGSAAITVTNPAPQPAPVATVTVSPSTASLQVGGTTQLSTVLRSSTGTVLTGRPVAWATSAPTVATVVNGLVTAVSAGQATITATSEGRSGSATITVTAPAPVPPPTTGIPELPSGYSLRLEWPGTPAPPPGWPTGWAGSPAGSATVVNDATAPASAPAVTQITYPSGFRSGNEPQTWEYSATSGASALVYTYWFKYSSGFQGEQSSVNKHIFVFATDGTPIGYTAARFSGTSTTGYIDWLFEQGATGSTAFKWLASSRPSIRLDQWHRVTVEVSRTSFRLWVDGSLVGSMSNATFKTIGVMKVAPTWGGNTGDVMRSAGRLFFDDLRIRTR